MKVVLLSSFTNKQHIVLAAFFRVIMTAFLDTVVIFDSGILIFLVLVASVS